MKNLNPWQLINAAERHGQEGDPRHEVGDLQDVVTACFDAMTDEQAAEVFDDWRMKELLGRDDL